MENIVRKKAFIQFGSFIIDKNEISYVKCDEEKFSVTVVMLKEGGDNTFTMETDSKYCMEELLVKLTIDLDALVIDGGWKHPLVKNLRWMKEAVSDLDKDVRKALKKLEKVKKEKVKE